MTRADALTILLRCVGAGFLFALVPVFMPFSWMVGTHRWLGLGDMPTGPVVEYLARSLSAFYAMMGASCLVLTTDMERYRPLVRFLGIAFALMSLAFFGVDLAVGMPWWWSASERPGGVVFGALMFVLTVPGATSQPGRRQRVTASAVPGCFAKRGFFLLGLPSCTVNRLLVHGWRVRTAHLL
jgi:hypothetical protein